MPTCKWCVLDGVLVAQSSGSLRYSEFWISAPPYAKDLAHIYGSKQDFKRSEFHVKKALGVYKAIGFDRPERHGDLLSYLAVMVDRQKRRSDAETYYREALRVYKMNRVQGENVEITEKNLALNQRRDVSS